MSATGGRQTTTELSPLDNRIACIIGDTALSGITKDGDTDALATEQTGPSNTQSEATPVVPEELEEPGPSIAPSMRRAPRVLSLRLESKQSVAEEFENRLMLKFFTSMCLGLCPIPCVRGEMCAFLYLYLEVSGQ
ncbi:unnamed protein product [Leuciscus chuanchicus]